MKQANNSEVAQLMQRISEEYEAAERALHGFVVTARHDFITARMEQIGVYHQRLQGLVGSQEGTRLAMEAINRAGADRAVENVPGHEASQQ